jgi:hypothetical protein
MRYCKRHGYELEDVIWKHSKRSHWQNPYQSDIDNLVDEVGFGGILTDVKIGSHHYSRCLYFESSTGDLVETSDPGTTQRKCHMTAKGSKDFCAFVREHEEDILKLAATPAYSWVTALRCWLVRWRTPKRGTA